MQDPNRPNRPNRPIAVYCVAFKSPNAPTVYCYVQTATERDQLIEQIPARAIYSSWPTVIAPCYEEPAPNATPTP